MVAFISDNRLYIIISYLGFTVYTPTSLATHTTVKLSVELAIKFCRRSSIEYVRSNIVHTAHPNTPPKPIWDVKIPHTGYQDISWRIPHWIPQLGLHLLWATTLVNSFNHSNHISQNCDVRFAPNPIFNSTYSSLAGISTCKTWEWYQLEPIPYWDLLGFC